MKEAIKLAIEKGGYRLSLEKQSIFSKVKIYEDAQDYYAIIASDPLFWQALDKALGWAEDDSVWRSTHDWHFHPIENPECTLLSCKKCGESEAILKGYKNSLDKRICKYGNYWLNYARQYFDLVLTGGDTEKFWQDLLNEEPSR